MGTQFTSVAEICPVEARRGGEPFPIELDRPGQVKLQGLTTLIDP